MCGGWSEPVVAMAVVAVDTAVVVAAVVVGAVADVGAGSGKVVAATAVGGTMGGASVSCEDAAPLPPHPAHTRSAATSHALRLAEREERKLSRAVFHR